MPGLRRILRKNGGAVKRQNLICRTFRRTKAGIDSAGRAGRIGRVYMALGACLQIGQTACESTSCAKSVHFFGQLRELVLGGSLKFFERGFLQRSVELFER
jgi:hypothetical protein